MRESIWQKDSSTTHILFELWLIMKFSPPERKLAKRTSVQCPNIYTVAKYIELKAISLEDQKEHISGAAVTRVLTTKVNI